MLSGKRIRDFEDFRADELGNTAYRHTLPKTLDWLSKLQSHEHESKDLFHDNIRRMIATDPSQRPTAATVSRVMKQCKTITGVPFTEDC